MPTRRSVLGATASGAVAGLAGCMGILSSGGGGNSGGSLDAGLLADPSLRATAAEPDWEEQFARASLTAIDCAALRDRDAPVADWATQRGTLERFPGVSNVEAVESVDQTAGGRYETSFGDGQLLSGVIGYAAGSVDVTAFQEANGSGDTGEQIDGHAVFSPDDRISVGVANSGIGAANAWNYSDADLEDASPAEYEQFTTALLERTIQRARSPPRPADWVADALDRLRPYQYGEHTLTLMDESSPNYIFAKGFDVDGEQTTVAVMFAAPTAEAFDDAWDREAVERQARRGSDAEVSVERDDRVGVGTATVATDQTLLASENYVG